MILPPGLGPVDPHILDGDSFRHSFAMHRDRQPLFALRGFDLIAIAPAMFIILHVIIKNEQIRLADLTKVSAPRNIGGLQNDNVHSPTVSEMTYVGLSMLRSN